jgi:ligand-binding sensor domain-containing protein
MKMSLWLRFALFVMILGLGTILVLVVGETPGLALVDLSGAQVETIIEAPSDDILYATLSGSNRGIYRSDDYGRSWQRVSRGPGEIINNLVIHPVNKRVFYASTIDKTTNSSNLWYSDDGGRSWSQQELEIATGDTEQLPVINTLTINPDDPNTMYIGTEGQGLYRARLKNEHFELIGGRPMQNLRVRDVVIALNGLVYAVTTEGLFVIDGDTAHKLESLPDAAVSLAIDPTDPDRLYAGTVAYGAYLSEDGGYTWQPLNAGLGWQPGLILKVAAIAIDKNNPQHLALTTAYGVGSHWLGDGVYESFNAGQHWVKIARRQRVVEQLLILKGGIFTATPQDGLTRYGDPLSSSLLAASSLRSLTNPSGMQLLIMSLTVALSSWTLLGRLPWIPRLERYIG